MGKRTGISKERKVSLCIRSMAMRKKMTAELIKEQ